jgi:hypothetical protein
MQRGYRKSDREISNLETGRRDRLPSDRIFRKKTGFYLLERNLGVLGMSTEDP